MFVENYRWKDDESIMAGGDATLADVGTADPLGYLLRRAIGICLNKRI